MLADGRDFPQEVALDTAVVVVGAGPAGLTVATELAERGIDVCVLEAGPIREDRAARADAGGVNVDGHYYRLEQTRARGFGGTSQRWAHPRGVRMHRLQPVDLERREGLPRSGWPFGYEELARYYPRAEARCGLDDRGYAPETWADGDRPSLPLPEDTVATTVFRFAPEARFDQLLPSVAAHRGVQVIVNATSTEVLTDEAGAHVHGVRATTASGQTVTARARVVVLAAGGIDNARLLLASTGARRAGLGNDRGLVGRFFMEHPHARTGVVRLRDPSVAGRVRLYDEHDTGKGRIQAQLHPTAEVVRREGLVNSAWWVFARHPAQVSPAGRALVGLRELAHYRRLKPGTVAHLRTVVSRPVETVRALRVPRAEAASRASCLQLAFTAEQVPNPESRVTLGRQRDRYGLPVARLDWRLSALDRDGIRRTQDILDESFRRAGIGRLEGRFGDEFPPSNLGGGSHHMGTTRMHGDPERGVVDANCRVHGVGNLYLAGSSVFPTGGFANPTLSIIALACRLADHLQQRGDVRGR